MTSRISLSPTYTFALSVIAALSTIFVIVVLMAPPAQAAIEHEFLSQITEVPASSGAAVTGPLGDPDSMTVDSGQLYFAGSAEWGREETAILDRFDTASNAFSSQFPSVPPSLEYLHQGVAVGHTGGVAAVYVGGDELVEGSPHGVVAVFDAAGDLEHVWTGLTATPGSGFGCFQCGAGPGDVAVDNSGVGWAAGDVYVADPVNAVVDVFAPETGAGEESVTQITGTAPGSPFVDPQGVAVSQASGDVLVVDAPSNGPYVVDIFKPAALPHQYEFVGKLQDPPQGALERFSGVTVDGGNGDIYLSEEERNLVYQFNSEGAYLARIASTPSGPLAHPVGLAVDPETHRLYIGVLGSETEPVAAVEVFGPGLVVPDVTTGATSSVKPNSVTLAGTVNPDKAGEATCQFAWGTSEAFGHVAPCSAAVAEGESPVPVSARIEGLQPDTTYYYRLQASNANGVNQGEASQDMHFTTPGPGLQASAESVSSTSASLAATIAPNGVSTTYYFQYGTTTGYGAEAPAAPGEAIGSGPGDVEVTQHIQSLLPQTLYHFRVVAVSDLEVTPGVFQPVTFEGSDQTFTTQPAGGSLVLPDGRAWELVSPADKHGATIFPLASPFKEGGFRGLVQASASGDSITYLANAPVEAAAPAYILAEQVLSKHGSHGWSSQDLGLPHRTSPGATGQEFQFFSEDLSLALADPAGPFTSLVPEATPPDTERTLYLRHDDTCGTQPSTCYLPLATGAPGYADVPPGTVIDPDPGSENNNLQFVGATTDLSHVLFVTRTALTSEPVSAVSGLTGLYEWSAGKPPAEELQLISGEMGGEGHQDNFPVYGKNAISKDGSRVIFPAPGAHLDQRDTTHHQTVQLDEVQPGASGAGPPRAFLQAASSDGSVVYFTDSQKLTKESGGSAFRPDLYECRMLETSGKDKCSLTDLTPKTGTESADVERLALGASEDGAYIYFVAAGVLSNQPDSAGESAVAGGPNLYEIHDGATKLVAVLSPEDRSDWNGTNSAVLEPSLETTRVSPGGRYVAFMSDRSLTGYDNVDASSGKPDEEVFLFDSTTGRLVCASCNPSGARPEGVELEGGVDAAANIPGWTEFGSGASLRQPRYLSDSGRLFFNSSDALVGQDVNKEEDVYEYEPVGVGDCSASSPGYELGSAGCVGLISSGTARGESTFMEASESGDDVFFLTTERLVGSDTDTAADVYDAHVCSTAAPCSSVPSSPPPPCATADACRAAPSPQPGIFGSPSSATFSGVGNVTPPAAAEPKAKSKSKPKKCRKGFVKKRGKCVKAKRSAKEAGHNRRGK
jgi:hypothetical protein